MRDVAYVLGTVEYLMVELRPADDDFTESGWTVNIALSPVGVPFVNADADWTVGTFETVDDKLYARVLLGFSPIVDAGRYEVYVSLEKDGEAEAPVFKAVGTVTVR